MNRRNLLMASAGLLAGAATAPAMRSTAWAQSPAADGNPPKALKAVKRTLEINGKSASVFGLVRDGGARGINVECEWVERTWQRVSVRNFSRRLFKSVLRRVGVD